MAAEEKAPTGASFPSGDQKQPIILTKEQEKTILQEDAEVDPLHKTEMEDEPLTEDYEEDSPDKNADAKQYHDWFYIKMKGLEEQMSTLKNHRKDNTRYQNTAEEVQRTALKAEEETTRIAEEGKKQNAEECNT